MYGNFIRTGPVPNKIRVLGWRVAKDNLATQMNTHQRTSAHLCICPVCGSATEKSYHEVANCTKDKGKGKRTMVAEGECSTPWNKLLGQLWSKLMNRCEDVNEAEALAIRSGLQLERQHPKGKFIIESHSATAVNHILKRMLAYLDCGIYIQGLLDPAGL